VTLLLFWAVVYCTYGALDEWLQQFVGRGMSLSDWVWDVIGVLVATATLAVTRSRSALSERRPTG
jgi:VanZ family protein